MSFFRTQKFWWNPELIRIPTGVLAEKKFELEEDRSQNDPNSDDGDTENRTPPTIIPEPSSVVLYFTFWV